MNIKIYQKLETHLRLELVPIAVVPSHRQHAPLSLCLVVFMGRC